MTRLLGALAVAAGITAACKSHDAREAERSAERVRAKTTDLQQEQRDLGKAEQEIADELGDVAAKQAEVDRAARDFEQKRAARVANLEGQFAVLETVPVLISRMAASVELTAGERVKLDEKLQVLRVRIDEAKQLLAKLPTTAAADWTARDDELTRALRRVEKARDEATEVIEDSVDDRAGS